MKKWQCILCGFVYDEAAGLPEDGIAAIGSGGPYALAAARALSAHTTLSARQTVEAAMQIADGISGGAPHARMSGKRAIKAALLLEAVTDQVEMFGFFGT